MLPESFLTMKEKLYILIAERDPFMQNILKSSLEGLFEIEFVEDGMEVFEKVIKQTPDVVVLEVLLPTLDGFQVCEKLKSNPSTRKIPVLFFTLLLAEERAKQAGADGFLLKPFRKEAFISTIESLVVYSLKREE
jgi:two-component system response regulator MprA